jgi:hypothetical protein
MEKSTAGLLDYLDDQLPAVSGRIAEAFRAEVPFYAPVPSAELRPGIEGDMRRAIAALREGRALTADDVAESARVAEERARQGVPSDAMMQAFRLAVREIWALLRGEGARRGVAPEAMLDLSEDIWRIADSMMQLASVAHREIELEAARRDDLHRTSFLHGVLFGAIGPADLAAQAAAYGLAADRAYVPFRARHAGSAFELERELRSRLAPAIVGVLDGDVAGLLAARPFDADVGAPVGVGPLAHLDALEASFQLASRALDTACAFGLTGVHALDDLTPEAIVVSEAHLGRRLVERYLGPLDGAFGRVLEDTLHAWFEHSMSVDRTAKALFVHPNTLRLRLRRIEELTGADLRRTRDVVELWLALLRRRADG